MRGVKIFSVDPFKPDLKHRIREVVGYPPNPPTVKEARIPKGNQFGKRGREVAVAPKRN